VQFRGWAGCLSSALGNGAGIFLFLFFSFFFSFSVFFSLFFSSFFLFFFFPFPFFFPFFFFLLFSSLPSGWTFGFASPPSARQQFLLPSFPSSGRGVPGKSESNLLLPVSALVPQHGSLAFLLHDVAGNRGGKSAKVTVQKGRPGNPLVGLGGAKMSKVNSKSRRTGPSELLRTLGRNGWDYTARWASAGGGAVPACRAMPPVSLLTAIALHSRPDASRPYRPSARLFSNFASFSQRGSLRGLVTFPSSIPRLSLQRVPPGVNVDHTLHLITARQ